ncbi:MAG: cytoplasmic protein [Candidatus Omnitrophica bacterium]|nr:cytoplasmic protein [Candidatus Omnitrophota bacterium]
MGENFQEFSATYLYCDNCDQVMPVAEKLLLILPEGYLYQYICKGCGKVVGDKKSSLSEEDKSLFL